MYNMSVYLRMCLGICCLYTCACSCGYVAKHASYMRTETQKHNRMPVVRHNDVLANAGAAKQKTRLCVYTCIHMYIHMYSSVHTHVYVCLLVCVSISTTRSTQILHPNPTWTPKVCRMMALYRKWAIILATFWRLGRPKPLNPKPYF